MSQDYSANVSESQKYCEKNSSGLRCFVFELQELEEGIGDVDLFTLLEDRETLTVNAKWLQHLQVKPLFHCNTWDDKLQVLAFQLRVLIWVKHLCAASASTVWAMLLGIFMHIFLLHSTHSRRLLINWSSAQKILMVLASTADWKLFHKF